MSNLLLTEEEKRRILNLYSNFIISEQKFNRVYSNPKTNISSEKRREDINRYFANEKIVRNLIKNKEQLAIWDEMISDEKQRAFVADIVRHIQGNPLVTGLFLTKGTEEIKQVQLDKNPGIEIKFDEQKKTNFYFRDNESELTEEGKTDIENTIFAQIILNIKENEDSNKCISSLIINSSASRFRNTAQAEKLSFAQLSKLRNDSVRDYIMQRLTELGITLWCSKENNIVQNINGSNGDGTSGPNPPAPTPFIPKGQTAMNPPSTDNAKRNEFGQPHTTKEEYDVYKYTRPTLTVAFSVNNPPDDVSPAETTKTVYDVQFFKGKETMTKVTTRRTPKFKKLPIPNVISGVKMVDCPVFNR